MEQAELELKEQSAKKKPPVKKKAVNEQHPENQLQMTACFLFCPDCHLIHWARNHDIIGGDMKDMKSPLHSSSLSPPHIEMENQTLPFTCALVTGGGGGGVGKALASYLTSSKSIKILIAGRTESNLEAAAQETDAAGYYTLDTGYVDTILSFITKIITRYPDLDCLINKIPAHDSLSKAD